MKHILTSLSLIFALSINTLCFGMDQEGQQQVTLKKFFQKYAPTLFETIAEAKKNDDSKAVFKQYLHARLLAAENGLTTKAELDDKKALDLESEYMYLVANSTRVSSIRAKSIGLPPQAIKLYAQTIHEDLDLPTYIKLGCYPADASPAQLHVGASRDLAKILLKELDE